MAYWNVLPIYRLPDGYLLDAVENEAKLWTLLWIETAISEMAVSEIDLIAVNEFEKYAEFIEVKRNATEINMEKLREKSYGFMRATGELKDYRISYLGLSLNEM